MPKRRDYPAHLSQQYSHNAIQISRTTQPKSYKLSLGYLGYTLTYSISTYCTGDLIELFNMNQTLLVSVISKPELSLHVSAECDHLPSLYKHCCVVVSDTYRCYYKPAQILYHCWVFRAFHLSLQVNQRIMNTQTHKHAI